MKNSRSISIVIPVFNRERYLAEAIESALAQTHSPDTQINVHLGCAIFRKSVFDKVGKFDETLRFSEDRDWFFRANEMNVSMIVLQENTLFYRLHENNMTRNKTIKDVQYLRILKKSIDRRRQQNQGLVKPLPKLSDFDEAKKNKNKRIDPA